MKHQFKILLVLTLSNCATAQQSNPTSGSDEIDKRVLELYQLDLRNHDADEFDFLTDITQHHCSGGRLFRAKAGNVDIANRQYLLALTALQTSQTIDFRITGDCDGNRALVSWIRLNEPSPPPVPVPLPTEEDEVPVCEDGETRPIYPTQIRVSNNNGDIILGGENPSRTTFTLGGMDAFEQYTGFVNLREDASGEVNLPAGHRIFHQGPNGQTAMFSATYERDGRFQFEIMCPLVLPENTVSACHALRLPGEQTYMLALTKGSGTVRVKNITIVGINRLTCLEN